MNEITSTSLVGGYKFMPGVQIKQPAIIFIILWLFDVLMNFLFTTSEMKHDYK